MLRFNEISQEERDALRYEFEHADTTDERRIEILNYMQECAAEVNAKCCIYCKKPIVYAPYTEALIRGHVYSEAGLSEVHITQMCEYCFDEVI